MKKILSLLFALFIFALAQTSVLAQAATPMNASPSATPLEISPLESNLSTPVALVTRSPNPKPEQPTASKILTSMPKASFVVLIFVFAVLLIELFLLISKKERDEKVPKVIPEVALSEPDKGKKNKTLLSLLILVLLLVAIPLTLVLVKQRQEIRKKAAEPVCTEGRGDCSGAVAEGDRTAQQMCYSWAGSGCDWRGDPYSGSCYCRGVGATPVPGQGEAANITCKVEGSSITFKNNGGTSGNRTVNGQWCQSSRGSLQECQAANNNFACSNSGNVSASSGDLGAGQSKSVSVGGIACGIWQIDFADCEGRSAKGCNWNDSCAPVATAPPTTAPTTAPTLPPTTAPTTIPTPTPTTPPSNPSSTPAPTNAPNSLSCNHGPCNDQNNTCASGLVCVHDTWFGHDQWVCRNNDCQIESDCICKQAENPPGPTSPPVGAPGQTARPYVVPPAGGQIILPTPAPTINVPVIPVAGIDGPTLAIVFIGALLLIAGLALAL